MGLKCIECRCDSPKYKCPRCYSWSCSANCWKKHKDGENCQKQEYVQVTENNVKDRSHITDDTVPMEKLLRLGSNNSLKNLLKDPLLQKLLIAVDSSPDAYDSVQKAMQDSSFAQFVDLCLNTVEENGSVS